MVALPFQRPLGLLALIAVAIFVILYLRRPKPQEKVIPSLMFVIKDKHGKYVEIESSADEPVLVIIPKNNPSAHINTSNQIARVLALADVAWRPNDNEMKNTSFDDYDWEKWKKT